PFTEVRMAAKPLCSIPDCGKRVKTRGWCSAHYERWRLHGDPLGLGFSQKRKTYRRLDITLTCEQCGADFHPWRGRELTSKFCSKRCNHPNMMKAAKNTDASFMSYIEVQPSGCWEWQGFRNHGG